MNYLAHAWLARHSDEAILGAILGDFVFGQSTLQDWPVSIRSEIVRHRLDFQNVEAAELGDLGEGKAGVVDQPGGGRVRHQRGCIGIGHGWFSKRK